MPGPNDEHSREACQAETSDRRTGSREEIGTAGAGLDPNGEGRAGEDEAGQEDGPAEREKDDREVPSSVGETEVGASRRHDGLTFRKTLHEAF